VLVGLALPGPLFCASRISGVRARPEIRAHPPAPRLVSAADVMEIGDVA
jgi:hypothetical protein